MNLRAIANAATSRINPNVPAVLKRSNGYVTRSNGTRVPTYDADVPISAQVQAMSGGDLRQVEGLNIQGQMRGIYVNGAIDGVVRVGQQGGDLIVFAAGVLLSEESTWLCVHVLEQWSDWAKVVAVLQNGS